MLRDLILSCDGVHRQFGDQKSGVDAPLRKFLAAYPNVVYGGSARGLSSHLDMPSRTSGRIKVEKDWFVLEGFSCALRWRFESWMRSRAARLLANRTMLWRSQ